MGHIKVNQENENGSVATSGDVGKKGAKASLGTAKSFIPVPKASPPKNNENGTPAGVQAQKARRPLAPMQHAESPQVRRLKSTGKVEVMRKRESVETPKKGKNECVEKAVGTDQETENLPASAQLHRAFPGTPHNSPSKMKTRKSSIAGSKELKMKTDKKIEEKETIAYWKELAESRRQALDAALQENYELHNRVQELEKEKAELEEIVKEAEKLANMVTDAAEDDELILDESGIVDTSEGTAV